MRRLLTLLGIHIWRRTNWSGIYAGVRSGKDERECIICKKRQVATVEVSRTDVIVRWTDD